MNHQKLGFFGISFGVMLALSGCGSGPGASANQQSSQEQSNVQTTSPGNLKINFSSIAAIDIRNLTLAQLNNALDPADANSSLPGAMAGLAGEASLSVSGGSEVGTSQPITGLSVTLLFDPTKTGGQQCLGDAAQALAEGADFDIEGNGVVAQLAFTWTDVFDDNTCNGASMENNILNLWQQTANSSGNNQNGVDFKSANIGIVLTGLTHCAVDTTDSGNTGTGGTQPPSWDITSNKNS